MTRAAAAARKVAGWHLFLSALLFALLLAPMLFVWYPRPLFTAAGGGRVAVVVAVLAALLGPLCGFLLAHAGKRRLRPIAVAQLVVLAGCLLALYVNRPVYLVFTVDRFDLVLARNLDPRDLAQSARPEFRRRPLDGPRYVAVLPPAEAKTEQRILDQALGGGKDLQMYPQYYADYAGQAQNALKRARAVDLLTARDGGAIGRYLESAGRTRASVLFLPLRAPNRDGVVLLDAASGAPLQVLLVDPW